MIDQNNIKQFVRKTLRCTCPDDVFQHIQCRTNVATDLGIVLGHEINVGNRLLIYVVNVVDDQLDRVQGLVSHLVRRGTRRRDEQGFNRFRLVLVAADPQMVEERASDVFNSLAVDDRVHLHVIGQDELAQIEE
ncbi:MAG: hypothetical protein ACYS74_01105 [Planctomycetota bacterium]|jgi:hypothetical protein